MWSSTSARNVGRGASNFQSDRGKQRNPNSEQKRVQKPPLTHFISIPIGHDSGLHRRWTQISQALINASPAIPGIDRSVIIKPEGLHVTLGIMNLRDDRENHRRGSGNTSSQLHSVQDALALLKTLQAPIQELMKRDTNANPVLYFPMDQLDIMRNGRNRNSEHGHVLWAGPNLNGELGKRLKRVCDLVHSTFKDAGYLQDDRPLKLHCTLINTIYRKFTPAPTTSFSLENTIIGKTPSDNSSRRRNHNQRERIPFSFSSFLSSDAYRLMNAPDGVTAPINPDYGPFKIDLGTWLIDEIQICRMGSQDAQGVYQKVGGISLL
ncbi:hypothetical protein Clacol_009627 [Clathrus columnatus]|uniref:A-kinase anchor protein 7-like phosphoesterase domain-containing protein n=1 Tax=Clathrus columnatus TaxID=1419009 RepID=A0AAV5ASM8_9AGAM|nr:hypothetical protein Clacol_009627 [Clathrus columnatus]